MHYKSLLVVLASIHFLSCSEQSKEDNFWDWFSLNSQIYHENENTDPNSELHMELTNQLKQVHPDLVWQIGQLKEGQNRELTISADGIKELFPIVIGLVETAPEIPNWKINAFRQRVQGDDLGIESDSYSISYSDIYLNYHQDGEQIGIELFIKDYTGDVQEQNAVFLLLDALLGEYDTETKIGWIEWNKLENQDTTSLVKFYRLRDIIDQKTE